MTIALPHIIFKKNVLNQDDTLKTVLDSKHPKILIINTVYSKWNTL